MIYFLRITETGLITITHTDHNIKEFSYIKNGNYDVIGVMEGSFSEWLGLMDELEHLAVKKVRNGLIFEATPEFMDEIAVYSAPLQG